MRLVAALLAVFVFLGVAEAQTISGSIVGSVVDSSELAVSGVPVTLTYVATGAERQMVTDDRGGFAFPALQPGEYTVEVNAQGFKRYTRQGINLSAQETLPVGTIRLEDLYRMLTEPQEA